MASKTSKIMADLRKQKGWSQAEMADRSGVSREMIGKYERGESVPSIDAAKKIADPVN
jgi:transcriptional regulator with XRE-family HTH domain